MDDVCQGRHKGNANSFLANSRISKKKQSLRQRVYFSLRDDGPQTCEELSRRLMIRYTTVSGRLSELKAARWVMPSGATRKTTGGSDSSVMEALDAKQREGLLNPARFYTDRQKELFSDTAAPAGNGEGREIETKHRQNRDLQPSGI